jgi:hypothetical protein
VGFSVGRRSQTHVLQGSVYCQQERCRPICMAGERSRDAEGGGMRPGPPAVFLRRRVSRPARRGSTISTRRQPALDIPVVRRAAAAGENRRAAARGRPFSCGPTPSRSQRQSRPRAMAYMPSAASKSVEGSDRIGLRARVPAFWSGGPLHSPCCTQAVPPAPVISRRIKTQSARARASVWRLLGGSLVRGWVPLSAGSSGPSAGRMSRLSACGSAWGHGQGVG